MSQKKKTTDAPKKVKLYWLIIVIVIMAASLGALVLQNERIVQDGEIVKLQTRPVDPRDWFRGDYVQLRYEISTIPTSLAEQFDDKKVYVSLAESEGKHIATGVYLSPPEGLYVSGRARADHDSVFVTYDFDKLFVPEGEGRELEKAVRAGDLLIDLRVKNGRGVITGYELYGEHYDAS